MSSETSGVVVTHARCSFGTYIGSLKEAFDTAVCDVLGTGTYLNLIRARVEALAKQSNSFSGPTVIHAGDAARAEASGGFKKLNGMLDQYGLRASLEPEGNVFHGVSPYLRLAVGPK